MVDRKSRDLVAAEVRRFLSGNSTSFDFDKSIFEVETDDQTVNEIVHRLWFHYDDLIDHSVALTKGEWDYFQRLLLVLESDRKIHSCISLEWTWTQLIALVALVSIGLAGIRFGLSLPFLLTLVPLGITSMSISIFRHCLCKSDQERMVLEPFANLSELRQTYLQVDGFRKQRIPVGIAGARTRSGLKVILNWMPLCFGWIVFSPLVLCVQVIPIRRVASAVHPIGTSGSA